MNCRPISISLGFVTMIVLPGCTEMRAAKQREEWKARSFSVSPEVYDEHMFAMIKARWIAFLENYTIPGDRKGTAKVRFEQWEDGDAREVAVVESTATERLSAWCVRAIVDSAPFGPWPDQLKTKVGKPSRKVEIMFYYSEPDTSTATQSKQ